MQPVRLSVKPEDRNRPTIRVDDPVLHDPRARVFVALGDQIPMAILNIGTDDLDNKVGPFSQGGSPGRERGPLGERLPVAAVLIVVAPLAQSDRARHCRAGHTLSYTAGSCRTANMYDVAESHMQHGWAARGTISADVELRRMPPRTTMGSGL